jgi:uncharacterized OB-fold protein
MAAANEPAVLRAPMVIEYPFSRTTGPVIGAFLTGLREGVLIGIKGTDGRVLMPPMEYDPNTSESLTELVEVGQEGEVVSWTWTEGRRYQPIEGRPFAWALVKIDGTDTPMLHAVDVASSDQMSTGMRVRVRWRAEREGHIRDIECFEPVA